MRYIITENQVENFLQKYYNKLNDYPGFEWIDKIDINKTTTRMGGWNREHTKPVYQYRVFIKSGYSVGGRDKDKLIDDISKVHSMLFPTKGSNPEAYFGVEFFSE